MPHLNPCQESYAVLTGIYELTYFNNKYQISNHNFENNTRLTSQRLASPQLLQPSFTPHGEVHPSHRKWRVKKTGAIQKWEDFSHFAPSFFQATFPMSPCILPATEPALPPSNTPNYLHLSYVFFKPETICLDATLWSIIKIPVQIERVEDFQLQSSANDLRCSTCLL